jgi:protein-S-isoprenylcysteine O-methyltransferase Ste14
MRISRWRVRLGFVLGAAALYLAQPTSISIAWGFPLAILGEALRLWASGHIEKTQSLATGGPYAHSRNPLYLGSLTMSVGFAIAAANLWVFLALVAYFALFLPPVIGEEAAFLRAKFPADFDAWARAVPLLLPRLTPGGPRRSRFQWRTVRANREWKTVLALPLIAALLLARAWFRL